MAALSPHETLTRCARVGHHITACVTRDSLNAEPASRKILSNFPRALIKLRARRRDAEREADRSRHAWGRLRAASANRLIALRALHVVTHVTAAVRAHH